MTDCCMLEICVFCCLFVYSSIYEALCFTLYVVCFRTMTVYAQTPPDDLEWVGIRVNPTCLETWTCKRNMYQTLGIREDLQDKPNPFEFFVADVFLAATFFIGTVITFALVYSWFLIVMGWASDETVAKGKNGIKRSLIWLVLVMFSYSIIRGVQFIAQGNG